MDGALMVGMKRNRKQFFVRHADEADGMVIYHEPKMVCLNLFPTTADSDLAALGKEYIEYMRARISIREADRYGVGDLIYTEIPEYRDIMDVGNSVYRITAILPMLNVSEILCRRMSGSS